MNTNIEWRERRVNGKKRVEVKKNHVNNKPSCQTDFCFFSYPVVDPKRLLFRQ